MKKFALLGSNINYSLSPKIHKLIGAELGIELDYTLLDVPAAALSAAAQSLKDGYDGFNITKPYKRDIIAYLDSLDLTVEKTGAVNTVAKRSLTDGGKYWRGWNTDTGGFSRSLEICRTKIKNDTRVLILGAGGAAACAATVLEGKCDLYLYNIDYEEARRLFKSRKIKIAENAARGVPKAEVIINCTPLGWNGENCLPENIELKNLKLAYDMVYKSTPFLSAAAEIGAECMDGLNMLVFQAIEAECIFNEIYMLDDKRIDNICKKVIKQLK